MMYPYCKYADETEVVFSHIMKNENGEEIIHVHFERPTAKFFRERGYADELGSGSIKITKNSYLYSGKPPIFEDKEMFRVTIPLLRDEMFRRYILYLFPAF